VSSAIIFADESGDLGWTFEHPYRNGGSSRHLTVAAICVPPEKKHVPKRIVRKLYDKYGWPTCTERKWVDMPELARTDFARAAVDLCQKNTDISLHAIIVNKVAVGEHIRKDPNKLYNFMVKVSLLDCIGNYDTATFIPDERSIKVESGNSLHDYLQTELWFTKKVKTILKTQPLESKNCLGIQFADMLSGVVQSCIEDRGERERADFDIIATVLKPKFLFFKVSKSAASSGTK
jgi:Protein of unknown function (DUF3800)